MKRFFSLILAVLFVFALCACDGGNSNETTGTTAEPTYEIDWSDVPDSEIVGAWEPEDSVSGEYVLFTDDGKLRIVHGTIVFDASIKYGVDGYGNTSAYTEGNYLYGQWVYVLKGDKLIVKYSEDEVKTFNRVDYTPVTLQTKEGFVKDDKLVGKWLNKQYADSYQFTEDGFAIYHQDIEDGIYVYDSEIKYSYTVKDNVITLYYYGSNELEEETQTFEYKIDGTKLLLDGKFDYYLNGEGAPEPDTTPATLYIE